MTSTDISKEDLITAYNAGVRAGYRASIRFTNKGKVIVKDFNCLADKLIKTDTNNESKTNKNK